MNAQLQLRGAFLLTSSKHSLQINKQVKDVAFPRLLYVCDFLQLAT